MAIRQGHQGRAVSVQYGLFVYKKWEFNMLSIIMLHPSSVYSHWLQCPHGGVVDTLCKSSGEASSCARVTSVVIIMPMFRSESPA